MSIPLGLEINKKARTAWGRFEAIANSKLVAKQAKHGPLVGDTDFYEIYEHLLEEVAELIAAVDGKFWKMAIVQMTQILMDNVNLEDGVPIQELADVYNVAKVAAINGQIQEIWVKD